MRTTLVLTILLLAAGFALAPTAAAECNSIATSRAVGSAQATVTQEQCESGSSFPEGTWTNFYNGTHVEASESTTGQQIRARVIENDYSGHTTWSDESYDANQVIVHTGENEYTAPVLVKVLVVDGDYDNGGDTCVGDAFVGYEISLAGVGGTSQSVSVPSGSSPWEENALPCGWNDDVIG